MNILIAFSGILFLVLFVFALLLLISGLVHYAGHLIQENGKNRTQLNSMLGAIKFITFTSVGGKLTFFRVFLASAFTSFLIVLSVFLMKLVSG